MSIKITSFLCSFFISVVAFADFSCPDLRGSYVCPGSTVKVFNDENNPADWILTVKQWVDKENIKKEHFLFTYVRETNVQEFPVYSFPGVRNKVAIYCKDGKYLKYATILGGLDRRIYIDKEGDLISGPEYHFMSSDVRE